MTLEGLTPAEKRAAFRCALLIAALALVAAIPWSCVPQVAHP